MRSVTVLILFAFVARELAQDRVDSTQDSVDSLVNELVDDLFEEVRRSSLLEHADLKNSTLGSQLTVPPREIRSALPSLRISPRGIPGESYQPRQHENARSHLPHRSQLRSTRVASASLEARSKPQQRTTERVYPEGFYDPEAARAYFSRRPADVVARATSLVVRSAGFGLKLLADFSSGQFEANSKERAAELAKLLVKLGPTFIKVGQSASIRSDLLPAAFIKGLTQLQDEVPPFPSDQARAILREELGDDLPFLELTDEPIASASLGQVYKGALRNGTEVAVKVQRPNMERQVALDMHLIRDFAAPLATKLGVPGDLVGTADAWGKGFVDELNYKDEAANAERFNRDIANSPMDGRVFAPCVVPEASTRRVLTTIWISGERLDRCSVPSDVPRMCSVAMNTYLEMMLDTGVLHCDPHPGNLMRTADGKLCILDWGLVTCIRPDLQLTLIEHVAHLTAKDYAKVPNDLVKLEFVPEGSEAAIVESGVMEFLNYTYSTWGSGGGATKLDVPKLLDEVQELSSKTENGLFQVPPYFAYVAKSFSVLEGIGLSIDPNYSIVDETLPYIARRILTDPSPRTAGALGTYIFGDAKDDVASRVLNARRVEQLLGGARDYAAAISPTDEVTFGTGEPVNSLTVAGIDMDAAADTIFDVLLSKEPMPVQDIVLEQLALLIGAASREAFTDLRERSGTSVISGRSRLSTLIDPLGLLKGSTVLDTDARDREVLAAASNLASIATDLLSRGGSAGVPGPSSRAIGADNVALATVPEWTTADLRGLADILVRKLWARREELQIVLRRLAAKIIDQTMQRVLKGTRDGAVWNA